jgi:hypothetical protein
MVVSDGPAAEFVVGTDDFISNFELSFFESTNVEDVSVEYLDILDLEFRFPINGDDTSIVLLTTLLGIKVGFVEYDTEWGIGRKLGGGRDEFRRLVETLDSCLDVLET